MKNLINDLDSIFIESNNQINDKLFGINYLEQYKYILTEKLEDLLIKSIKSAENQEITKNFNGSIFLFKIINYPESVSKIKHIISNDLLSIILNGVKTIKIYDNTNKSKTCNLNLYKKNSIVLSKGSVISEIISKDTLTLDIINVNKVVDNKK